MKRIILSMTVIAAVAALAVGGTLAVFSDTETVTGNTFAAGSIDLELGKNQSLPFQASDLVPGQTVNAGTAALTNNSSIAGKFTLKITNVVSEENGLLEPEIKDGDEEGEQIDPSPLKAEEGDGELWDMAALTIYVDANNDGKMQWYEPVIWSGQYLDLTTGSGFHIPLDTDLGTEDLAHGFDGILDPEETVHVGLLFTFKTEPNDNGQPQDDGLTNNMAMSDTVSFDLVFGLEQIED